LPKPGSDGTQPWLDEEGRYTVRILFDTADHDGKASHQVRQAQQHSGPGYGTHFPLRPGVEVLMAFIDGDVDRPVIIGSAPNTVTPSPVAAQEALHHRIQTASGIKIEFEDGF
jgi:type VI secretion system secreted protein VgrG